MLRASGHGVAQAESDTCPIPDTPGNGLNLHREVPRSPHRCKIEHGGLRNRSEQAAQAAETVWACR